MPSEPNVPSGLTYQLRFEQFKQIATLAVAAAGGVLILLQAGYVESTFKSGAVVAAFALSASLALFGQDKLVEGLEAARAVPAVEEIVMSVAMGTPVEPLPEGDRYLGFIFARDRTPDAVERGLRTAFNALSVTIE